MLKDKLHTLLHKSCHPISLATFRVLFGLIMFISGLRFYLKGWIEEFYLQPTFHFKYFGFEWVHVLPEKWLYLVFALMLLSALGIMLGLFYRFSALLYFITFTYFELLDKTLYLNHYYFVSLVSLLLIFIPANKYASLDILLKLQKPGYIKQFYIYIIQLQIAILYFFAGIAKLNPDWLFSGQPMDIWLDKYHYLPIIGVLLSHKFTAIAFSWFGMLYDTLLPFLLWSKRTRVYAYVAVVVFHVATSLLFPIGVFPYVMIGATLIFFPPVSYKSLKRWVQKKSTFKIESLQIKTAKVPKALLYCVLLHFVFQLGLPLRHYLYPGNVLWTEEGFNFSWRVMLIEKSGVCNFFVRVDNDFVEVNNAAFLSPLQEKMMSTQADFILQYAHFLEKEYEEQYQKEVAVYCDAFVTFNGRPPKRYLDPNTDLTQQIESFKPKNWILH